MFEIVSFIIDKMLALYSKLDTIYIGGTNFTLWTYFKGLIFLNIIYGFLYTFFKMGREDAINTRKERISSAYNRFQFRRNLRNYTKETFKETKYRRLK